MAEGVPVYCGSEVGLASIKSRTINRTMVNRTRKVKEVSSDTLQKLTQKYSVTKSGSKNEVALRLWKLRNHVMTLGDLKIVEDFLQLAPAKRYTGPRYGRRKNGNLYCISGDC